MKLIFSFAAAIILSTLMLGAFSAEKNKSKPVITLPEPVAELHKTESRVALD